MFRLSPVVRITLALVMLTTTLVLSADMLNLIPDPSRIILGDVGAQRASWGTSWGTLSWGTLVHSVHELCVGVLY